MSEALPIGEAWQRLVAELEDAGVHHGRPMFMSKFQMYGILEALLEVAYGETKTWGSGPEEPAEADVVSG